MPESIRTCTFYVSVLPYKIEQFAIIHFCFIKKKIILFLDFQVLTEKLVKILQETANIQNCKTAKCNNRTAFTCMQFYISHYFCLSV